MAGEYLRPEIVTEADDLAGQSYARMQVDRPAFVPKKGHAETRLTEAYSVQNAEMGEQFLDLVDQASEGMFTLLGTPRRQGAPSTTTLTVTLRDTDGHTIPAGTRWLLANSGGDAVVAESQSDIIVPPGSASTGAGAVVVSVIEPGTLGDGYGVAGAQLSSPVYTWIGGVTATAATSGGQDPQDTAEYLDYATKQNRLLTKRPVAPGDWIIAALGHPLVGRALEIGGYDADTDTHDVALHQFVAVVGYEGEELDASVYAELKANQLRTIGGVTVHVGGGTETQIDAEVSYAVKPGYDPAIVDAAVESALRTLMSGKVWGAGAGGEQAIWEAATVVRFRDLEALVKDIDGVDYVHFVKIALHGAARSEQDVAIDGPAPLAIAQTVLVSHT